MTDKQPEALAFYVERVAPGMRDHGAKIGLWWKREAAEEFVDDRHVLRELVPREVVAKKDAAIKELREALSGVVLSWDSRTFERERFVKSELGDYWSPTAAMVDSYTISSARAALANTEDA